MHRHAKEAEMGLSSLANVTSLNEVLLTSPGDVFLQVFKLSFVLYLNYNVYYSCGRKLATHLIKMSPAWNFSLPRC